MGLLSSNQQQSPKLHSLKITQSVAGIVLPLMWGTNRLQLILLGFWDFTSTKETTSGGKGLGKNGTTYDYYATVEAALCGKPLFGTGSVWSQNGRLGQVSASEVYTVPEGGGTFTVANAQRFSNDFGVSIDASYDVQANDYGSAGPVTLTGVQQTPQQAVPGAPGAGQYTHDGAGSYTFPGSASGQVVTISYSYTLYTLIETEDFNVPNDAPYEVTVAHSPDFSIDIGVVNIATGASLSRSGSNPPPQGSYYCDNAGNYFFNAGDAELAVAINYAWHQSDSNIDPSLTFAFTLIGGDRPQSPWSYLLSRHPSQALSQPGVAKIGAANMYLGSSGEMPSYNLECFGPARFGAGVIDANLALVILDLITDPVFGLGYTGIIDGSLLTTAQAYWAANGFFVSPVLDSAQTGSSIIEQWCEAGNTAVFSSEGKLKFIPYGDTTMVANGFTFTPNTTPLFDLDDDDFMPDSTEDPVTIGRTPWQDAYNQVKVQFDHRDNNYNPASVTERNRDSIARIGLRPEGQKDYSFICRIDSATFAANVRLKRLVYIRKTYSFKLSAIRYPMLEQMDMVTLTDKALGLVKEPVRITEIAEDKNRILTITAEEFPWGTASATLYAKQLPLPPNSPNALADPGDATPFIFETTVQEANGLYNQVKIAAASQNPAWGGCKVWASTNGTSFEPVGTINANGRMGVTTSALPAVADPDTSSTLGVDTTLSQANLYTVDQSVADTFGTLFALFNPTNGAIELLSYKTAALTAQYAYNLSYLRRGCYGSNVAAWPAGSKFCRIDESVFTGQYQAQLVEQPLFFKFTSFNLAGQRTQDLSAVATYEVTLQGTTLGPPAPGVPQINRNPLGAYTTTAGVGHITVGTFVMSLNNLSATCLANGGVDLGGLNPGQRYTVYYVDRAFAGGAITPVATQNPADYTGQSGVYVIGSILTPSGSGGGGGGGGTGGYVPSSGVDSGDTTTSNIASAYDSDPTTAAVVSAYVVATYDPGDGGDPQPEPPYGYNTNAQPQRSLPPGGSYDYESYAGVCTFLGFPDTTPTGKTLSVTYAASQTASAGSTGSFSVDASFDSGSTWTNVANGDAAVSTTTAPLAVPAGTDLAAIQVRVSTSADVAYDTNTRDVSTMNVSVYDIRVA